MPLSTTFKATDPNGQMIVRKPTIEGLMAWLQGNGYFTSNPEQTLSLTEESTRFFEVKITADTSLWEIQESWKRFNGYV